MAKDGTHGRRALFIFETCVQPFAQALCEAPQDILSLLIKLQRHTLRPVISELWLVDRNPCSLCVIASIAQDSGRVARIPAIQR